MLNIFNFRMAVFRSPFQHKIIGHVKAPLSCLQLALHYEFPLPWHKMLYNWEYRLLKNYLCTGTRVLINFVDDLQSLISHKDFQWSVCCHDAHETSLEALARRVVITNIMKEIMTGFEYNIKYNFYRKFVNKNMGWRLFYVGSLMFRKLHLIFIKIDYWGDVMRIKRLKLNSAVVCYAYTTDFLVLICNSCADNTRLSAINCAKRTRAMLIMMAHYCEAFYTTNSMFEDTLSTHTDLSTTPCACL